jgi:hypothetical protein
LAVSSLSGNEATGRLAGIESRIKTISETSKGLAALLYMRPGTRRTEIWRFHFHRPIFLIPENSHFLNTAPLTGQFFSHAISYSLEAQVGKQVAGHAGFDRTTGNIMTA